MADEQESQERVAEAVKRLARRSVSALVAALVFFVAAGATVGGAQATTLIRASAGVKVLRTDVGATRVGTDTSRDPPTTAGCHAPAPRDALTGPSCPHPRREIASVRSAFHHNRIGLRPAQAPEGPA